MSGVEAVWALGLDSSRTSTSGGVSGTSRWEETPRDTLEELHFPTILEILGVHLETVAEDTLAHTPNARTDVKTSYL